MFENVVAFHRPPSIPEALQLLHNGGSQARFLSGGTDLISQGDRSIRYLVDLTHAGLTYIHIESHELVIGATTKLAELLESQAIRAFAGGILAQAVAGIGSVQLRNMATIGGKVITGGLAADMLTPLAVLDATALIETGAARRSVSLAAGATELREACLDGALLVEIRIPIPRPGITWSFQRFGRLDSGIALVTVAAGIELAANGHVASASIAVDGKRFPAARAGGRPDDAWIEQTAQQTARDASPMSDFRATAGYRRQLISVLTQRALRECAVRKSQSLSAAGTLTSVAAMRYGAATARERFQVQLQLNGVSTKWSIAPGALLLDVLRENGYYGAKRGCEKGHCGACTVLLNGRPVDSCLMFAAQVDGCDVLTIEGLEQNGRLHPLQEAFIHHSAVQCGFCTPGMILSAKSLLDRNAVPSEDEVREALTGNLCRCTGYRKPVEAVLAVAGTGSKS